jgi:cysteine synthase
LAGNGCQWKSAEEFTVHLTPDAGTSGIVGLKFPFGRHIEVDLAYRIPDQEAITIIYQLLREESIFVGLSSGINLAGAVRLAKERGPGQTIVTVLCDSGHKYQSKIFNAEWLAAHQLDASQKLEIAAA